MAKAKHAKQNAELQMTNQSGWQDLPKGERKRLLTFADEYRQFMSAVKTEREAHDAFKEMATEHGMIDLAEAVAEERRLKPGDAFYHSVMGKTIILGRVGTRPIAEGMRIVGGHIDSPRLDLKPRPLYEDGGMVLFDTHYYGGVKKYQWVTIPLALHGVIVLKNGKTITVNIGEDPADPVLVITDLLPHLAQDQGDKKLKDAISGEGLDVLVGSIPAEDKDAKEPIKLNVLRLLNDKYGIVEADFTSAELSLVPAGPARDLGLDRSMILAYGHDDRVCAYTAARAILDQEKTPAYTSLCLLCDKEEIGSVGSTGMYTFLFENAVAELVHLLVDDGNEDLIRRRCLKRSKMLSADVNSLHDPNYSDVSSPHNNMAKLNHGLIVTKYCGKGGKGGSNDAHAEFIAEVRRIFDEAGVIWQIGELGKVDQGGGGTISFMLARYEMDVVDCGPGLLSMHAPWEVAGKLDIYMAYKGYAAFYRS